jgi:hypothetical protein
MAAVEFAPVPLPPVGDVTRIADGIATWIGSAAMTAVLAEFGQEAFRNGSLADRLAELEEYSARRWDYRKGLERHQAVGEDFPPEVDARLRAAIRALGLLGQHAPSAREYDHVLVLGGGVRTMVARADLAASLLRAGLAAGTVAGLGSVRELAAQEEYAKRFGLAPCPTEGDAVDEALRHALRLGRPSSRRSGTSDAGQPWWLRSYLDVQPAVHVLAAPATRPRKRANTGDTLVGWADIVQPAPKAARLLLLTTDIFVPFQHCDAIRLLALPYGCSIDTIGFDTDANAWVPRTPTFALLQEVRSAIFSMRALCWELACASSRSSN